MAIRLARGRLSMPAVMLVALSFTWSANVSAVAAAAPRAEDLGPEVALTEPSGGYVGKLRVTPEHGPAGTPLTVTGEGFPAGQQLELVWRTVKGHWKVTIAEYFGREFVPVAYRIATLKSDKAGHISVSFVAPEDFGFLHDVVVQQADRLLTQTAFNLDMTVRIVGATSGPLGSPIEVEVQGIGWRELEGSWVLLYDNKYTGFVSTVTTGGTARFNVPATGHVGAHILEVLHTDFGSPYRNTQQSPVADRPQFKLAFAVTPGAPVLPPAAETQGLKAVRSLPPTGELVATPAFSGVDQPVTVTGTGFEPGKTYTLNWNTVVGNRMTGRGWDEVPRPIAETKADASGRVEFHIQAPDDLGGQHNLWVDLGGGKQKTGA